MLRTILFFLLVFGASTLSHAQFNEDDINDLAKASCECSEKNNISEKNAAEAEKILEQCLIESMLAEPKYLAKISTAGGEEEMTKVGEQIGIKMATMCPSAFIAMAMAAEDDEEESVEEPVTNDSNELSGKVIKMNNGTVSSITFQEEAGRKHTILIIEPFEGLEQLESISNLKGKNLTLTYEERSIYSDKMDDFVNQKVLTSITQ